MYRYDVPTQCSEHGATWHAGCAGCRQYRREVAVIRRRRTVYGEHQPQKLVDASEAREHLMRLHTEHGMTFRQLATELNMTPVHIQRLAAGTTSRVRESTRSAVLALSPKPLISPGLRDATGTRRRVQALACLGYSYQMQGELISEFDRRVVSGDAVSRWTKRHAQVTHAVHNAAARLYDKYSMVPFDTDNVVARRARAKGWAPVLAWDDDTIDDPDAKPDLGRVNQCLPDEQAVQLAMMGQLRKVGRPLNNAEKREVIVRGTALGKSGREISRLAGISHDAVQKQRDRMAAEKKRLAAEKAAREAGDQ